MTFEDAMLQRFPRGEYVTLFEVANEDATRRADAMTISLWQSRGMLLEGYELKSDRRDWLRELKKPSKAESLFSLCDRWWLVVTDPAIVKDGELPLRWGLFVLGDSGLRIKKEAEQLTPVDRPWRFIVRLLRRCQDTTKEEVARVEADAFQKARASLDEIHSTELKRAQAEAEQKGRKEREALAAIKEALGIEYIGDEWALRREVDQLKRALDLLRQQDGLKHSIARLRHLRDTLNVLDLEDGAAVGKVA